MGSRPASETASVTLPPGCTREALLSSLFKVEGFGGFVSVSVFFLKDFIYLF